MKINAFSHDLFESISEQKIHHWVGQAVELARAAYENTMPKRVLMLKD